MIIVIIVLQTDVTGKCSATFSPSATPGLITKVKDFKNCEMRTKLEGGIQATVLRKDAVSILIFVSVQVFQLKRTGLELVCF